MSGLILNPGSGPVDGGTAEQARDNMRVLVADVNAVAAEEAQQITDVTAAGEVEGRYVFTVTHANGETSEVDMPGLPLDRVRFMRGPQQDIWEFPRLWVNGSSWLWFYAINCLARDHDDE